MKKKYIYLGLLLFINLLSGADVREQEDEINRINRLTKPGRCIYIKFNKSLPL